MSGNHGDTPRDAGHGAAGGAVAQHGVHTAEEQVEISQR